MFKTWLKLNFSMPFLRIHSNGHGPFFKKKLEFISSPEYQLRVHGTTTTNHYVEKRKKSFQSLARVTSAAFYTVQFAMLCQQITTIRIRESFVFNKNRVLIFYVGLVKYSESQTNKQQFRDQENPNETILN